MIDGNTLELGYSIGISRLLNAFTFPHSNTNFPHECNCVRSLYRPDLLCFNQAQIKGVSDWRFVLDSESDENRMIS